MMLLLPQIYLVISVLHCVLCSPLQRRQGSKDGGPRSPPYLNSLAQQHGKLWFGTAADIPGPEQQNVEYMNILNDTEIFGAVTPANYMKVRT